MSQLSVAQTPGMNTIAGFIALMREVDNRLWAIDFNGVNKCHWCHCMFFMAEISVYMKPIEG